MTFKEFEIQLALGSLSYDIEMKLVNNKRTSKKILAALSKEKVYYVIRYWVAENPNTSIKTLTKLSTDKNKEVRSCAINNLATRRISTYTGIYAYI